jgi:hypothetical protein
MDSELIKLEDYTKINNITYCETYNTYPIDIKFSDLCKKELSDGDFDATCVICKKWCTDHKKIFGCSATDHKKIFGCSATDHKKIFGCSATDAHPTSNRFFSIQGYFETYTNELKNDSDIELAFCCDNCIDMIEEYSSGIKYLMFPDRGLFTIDALFRMNT